MREKKIIKNSIAAVMYKVSILMLSFISRKIFIIYIGKELLGLNSLFLNLLDFLNLADLGLSVAVQYRLYEPLVKKDDEKIASILCVTKKIFNCIGCVIMAVGFIVSFFVHLLIKETTYPLWYIRIAFLISVFGVAIGYFFVYKRIFFVANEEMSVINITDMCVQIFTVVTSIILMTVYKNYYIYLIINALSGLLSNLVISDIFNKRYPQLRNVGTDADGEFHEIIKDMKHVIPIKLSNFVYNSTDNIIISKILGLITVGVYSNYMTLINAVMGIEYMIGNVATASIGKAIKEHDDSTYIYELFNVYQYIQFVLANVVVVCFGILCTPFIKLWLGKEFLIGTVCLIVLTVDFFIHSMYQPAYVMYGASGQFKKDKYVTLISAIMNIVISIVLVYVIGLPGVIIGTLITDIYIWLVRGVQIVKTYLNKNVFRYFVKMIGYCGIFAISFGISWLLCNYIQLDTEMLEFVIKLVICLVIPNVVLITCTYRSREFAYCRKSVHKLFKSKE